MSPSEPLDNPKESRANLVGPVEQAALDQRFMELALEEARRAASRDEVPIGAIVVLGDRVLGRGHNLTRIRRDPTAHAELLALSQACRRSGDLRLPGATVYTTVEPCFMCAGALVHARVARVVWAVPDPKFGGCVSLGGVLDLEGANHRALGEAGPCADEARELLQSFFRSKRARRGPQVADESSSEDPD